jgi:hypothetical protein
MAKPRRPSRNRAARRRGGAAPDVSGLHAVTIQRRYPLTYYNLLHAPLSVLLAESDAAGDYTHFDAATHLRGWHEAGCQVFRIGSTLGALLAHTSLRGVSGAE